MLFNSFEFMVFLPVVFAGYWLVQRHVRLQNLLVVIASYVFYGWWDARFLTAPGFPFFVLFALRLDSSRSQGSQTDCSLRASGTIHCRMAAKSLHGKTSWLIVCPGASLLFRPSFIRQVIAFSATISPAL